MKEIITVDIGTTSMRAILQGVDGRAMHMNQHENMPELFNDGRVEQDPAAWQSVLLTVLKRCASAAETEGRLPVYASTTIKPPHSAPGSREPLPQNSKRVIQGRFSRAAAGGTSVTYQPDPALREVYKRQCRRLRALYQALAAPAFLELMK